MRFMMLMIPKGYETAPPGDVPTDVTAVEAMMKYNTDLQQAGVLISCDGLHPPSMGARVSFNSRKPTVTDGPFPETREVLGGYWIINVKSRQEAIDWAARCPASDNEVIEVRQIQEIEDYPDDVQKAVTGFDEMQNKPKQNRKIFVNLPVKDLNRSTKFFTTLGFTFNPQYTDHTAACMVVSDDICVMLLTEPKFKQFTPKTIADAAKTSEVLTCLTCDSRAAVDRMVRDAVAAGGSTYNKPQDHGFMYAHGFQDPDGHIWELVYMQPATAQHSEA